MEQTTDHERAALKRRVEGLLGGHGAHTALAAALGIERSTLLRIYTGETQRAPGYVEAVLELLEALPKDQWPARWRKS